MKITSWVPVLFTLGLCFTGCSGDEEKPQEPVSPSTDTSVYPEDPAMAGPEDAPGTGSNAGSGTAAAPPAPGSDATVDAPPPAVPEEAADPEAGSLTEDPFGAPKGVPQMNDKSDDSSADVPVTPPEVNGDVGGAMAGEGANTGKSGNVAPAGPKEPYNPKATKGKRAKKTSGGKRGGKAASNRASKHKGKVVAAAGKETRYVSPIMLNIRSKPSLKGKVVRRLLGGARIFVTIQANGWAKIKEGQYCRASQLSDTPTKKVSRAEANAAWKGK